MLGAGAVDVVRGLATVVELRIRKGVCDYLRIPVSEP
jgi:hypothetical protein